MNYKNISKNIILIKKIDPKPESELLNNQLDLIVLEILQIKELATKQLPSFKY